MGVPLDLGEIHSGFLSASAFNANNTKIEQALDKALDRTGSTDNSMEVDFDMGLNNIFNLKSAILSHQAVPLKQVMDLLEGKAGEASSLIMMEDRFFASGGERTISFDVIRYTPMTNSLMVFKNGEYQRAVFEYDENSDRSLRFNDPLISGDIVDIFGSKYDAQQYVNLAIEASTSARIDANSAQGSAHDASVAAQQAMWAAGYKFDINNQTGLTYTLVADDAGDFIRMDNPAANTVVVPSNSTVPFEIGTIILLRQVDDGTTTVVPTVGVQVNSPYASLSISDADFGVALIKVDTDEWDLVKAFGGVDTADLDSFNGEFDARLDDLFKELLSSNPTFVVNFKSLEDSIRRELQDVIEQIDRVEAGTIEGDQFVQRIVDLETDVGGLESSMQLAEGRLTDVENDINNIGLDANSFSSYLAGNGWQRLPSGMIMQWGAAYVHGGTPSPTETVIFPRVFPTDVLNVQLTYNFKTDKDGDNLFVKTSTNNSFTFAQNGKTSGFVFWTAIGY